MLELIWALNFLVFAWFLGKLTNVGVGRRGGWVNNLFQDPCSTCNNRHNVVWNVVAKIEDLTYLNCLVLLETSDFMRYLTNIAWQLDCTCSHINNLIIKAAASVFGNYLFGLIVVPYPCQTRSNPIDKITLFTVHLSYMILNKYS